MKVLFTQDKSHLVFVHETPEELKLITKFPAFIRLGMHNALPAILPVAYNVVSRLRAARKTPWLKFDPAVLEWLDSEFKLKALPAEFQYHTKPKDFQDIALRFLYTLESAGILLDPGMGKSKVALDYIWLKQFKKSVIVCPMALLFVWEDEIAKHRPELTFHTVKTTDWEIEGPGVSAADVTIINYTKADLMRGYLKRVGYDFIHVDEFLIKDPSTNRTKALTELARSIPYRCGGSGTLINNSPLDAFSPVRYLQPSLVGGNYTNFLTKYTIQRDMKGSNGEVRKAIVATRGEAEVRSILESCCIVMTKEKWLQLPPKHFKDVYVNLSDEQRETFYGLMHNYYVNFRGKDLAVDNPLVMLSKLYQIANGFVYFNKEETIEVLSELLCEEPKKKLKTSAREIEFFKEQPKIEALKKILLDDLNGKKAIIWFNMAGEFVLIEKLLKELGHSYLSIRGGEKDIGGKVRSFNKDASIRWLVCQAKSVNYGITVLGSKKKDLEEEGLEIFPDLDSSVCNQVFYSLNFSLEVYLQQQDRIHRLGQDHACTYYRIFTNTPVERKIRQAIEDKTMIKEMMLVDVAETMRLENTIQ